MESKMALKQTLVCKANISKAYLFTVLIASLSTGCASLQAATAQAADQAAPVCHGAVDCRVKWAAAQRWVAHNSAYDIEKVTNSLIKTYGPGPDDPNLAAEVMKVPLSDGGFKIQIKASCGDFVSCRPDLRDAETDFNKIVSAAHA